MLATAPRGAAAASSASAAPYGRHDPAQLTPISVPINYDEDAGRMGRVHPASRVAKRRHLQMRSSPLYKTFLPRIRSLATKPYTAMPRRCWLRRRRSASPR